MTLDGRPDWRDMAPEDFRADAPAAGLFDLEPCQVPPADDGCGTGDLIDLLDE
jgi:hypothetical protein